MSQNLGVKLYQFDGVDGGLSLLPLAARRALDLLGCKLSLDGFRSLSLDARSDLVRAGSGSVVDEALARRALSLAEPGARQVEPAAEPSEVEIPAEVKDKLGAERPLSVELWSKLSPLDRYALAKVCSRSNQQRIQGAYQEIVGARVVSTHLRPQGGVHMVSVVEKEPTVRKASAECWLSMSQMALEKLLSASGPKGDVLGTARLAGIMATKRTSEMIPLCHPLMLEHAEVDFETQRQSARLRIVCTVAVRARTGVEMEAMMGAHVAALTVYDMLKSIDRGMQVGPGRLLHKSGGRSGVYSVEGGVGARPLSNGAAKAESRENAESQNAATPHAATLTAVSPDVASPGDIP